MGPAVGADRLAPFSERFTPTSFPTLGASGAPHVERETILTVDDMAENLMVLGELLQKHYRVRAANSGARALQVAASDPVPDLILLDVMMPGMDGYAVLRGLRAMEATRHIPVIFVTAMDASEDEELGLELGAADYITKPIKPAVVLARVRAQLELKRAREWLQDKNVWLEREVARRMREAHEIQDASIRALAGLAEARDLETGLHIRRTQQYVAVLGASLRDHPHFTGYLRDGVLDLVVKAAPLHDIGKVGIPDQILLKPGRLTEAEFVIMRTHSRIGADAIDGALRGELSEGQVAPPDPPAADLRLMPLGFLAVARDIARSHHERWDGQGYPDALAGDAIPVPARLMALADVFDALSSQRVYKAAMPFEEAAAIILEGRRTQFDPDVVDAFVGRIHDFRTIHEALAETEASMGAKVAQTAIFAPVDG